MQGALWRTVSNTASLFQVAQGPDRPNAVPLRALSREGRELMIAANNGYLLAFDNLSGLPVWLS
jgi:hypothetical protein